MTTSSLPIVLALAAIVAPAHVQDVELRLDEPRVLEIRADDPILEEGRGPSRSARYVSDFGGTLHIWASSAVVKTVVRIEAGLRSFEDDGDGGRRTSCLALQVQPGQELWILVASSAPDQVGQVELRLVSAPETDETLAAARDASRARGEVDRLRSSGELEDAHALVVRTFEELLAVPGYDRSAALAVEATKLGSVAESLGAWDTAAEAGRRAVDHCTRMLPNDHLNLQYARGNHAITLRVLGDLPGARVLQEQVLEVFTRTLPRDHPQLQYARSGLARTLSDLGDLAAARVLQERVLEVHTRTLPEDHIDLQAARVNLAGTLYTWGDLAGARALAEQALEVCSRTLPDDHPLLQVAQINLAIVLYTLGDLSGARVLEEQVLEVRSSTLPEDHPDLLMARGVMASTLWALGDLAGALELQEQVLEVRSSTLPEDHPSLAWARGDLAETLHALGDLDRALELREQVLEVRYRTLPEDHPDLQWARGDLSRLLYTLGDLARARELQDQVLASVRTRATALHEESPRVARAGARQQLGHVFDSLALSFLLSNSQDPPPPLDRELFAAVESLRHVSVASPAVAQAIGEHPELRDVQLEIARLRTEINDRAPLGPREDQSTEDWRADLLQLSTERDGLERELRLELARAGFSASKIEVSSVAAALPPDAAAISYLRYPRGSPIDPETGESPPLVDSLIAFVVLPDGGIAHVELGPAAELELLALEWRANLGKPIERGVDPTVGEDSERRVGNALRERLLDPVLARVGDARTLHVVLDDFLHSVPLEALPGGPAGQDGRVCDGLVIQCEVSFGRLVAGRAPSDGGGTLLALGGVDFDAGPDREAVPASAASSNRSTLPSRFEPLRQTRYEVEDIAAQFEETFEIEPVLLQADEADKETLRALAPSIRWLHLATHGWFAPDVMRSQLDRTEDEGRRLALQLAGETVQGFAPEALCGLALAGANGGRDEIGRLPGILTAEELAGLDLRNCELAVLSACETNVGIRRAGQGIQSLQAALHAAGARTAITSLWKVDDAATRRLMEVFYIKLWNEGLRKAEALRQAKMALRAEDHPVRAWAAWVLTGDPQ